jgi:hypothetical protein
MYSSRHYSSVPFCDCTLPHQAHRTYSLTSSPLPTSPDRAYYPKQAATQQQQHWPNPPAKPINPLKISVPSAPMLYHARISSPYHTPPPTASLPSLPPITIQASRVNGRKRLSSISRNSGLFRLVITTKPRRKNSLPSNLVHVEYVRPPTAIKECQDLVDNFIERSTAQFPEPPPTASRVDKGSPPDEEDGYVQRIQLRRAQSLPQMSSSYGMRGPRTGRAKQNLSLDTNICLDGDMKGLNSRPAQLVSTASIQPLTSTQPPFKPRRPSAPLSLFPTSPTSSIEYDQSGYIDTASPMDGPFHPTPYLEQQVSVFEDDEEKLGLKNYFKLGLPKRSRRSQRKSDLNWKKALCWNYVEE